MDEPDALGSTGQSQGDGPETDAWWGSYSGWALVPSMIVSVLLTGGIVWVAWQLVERRHVQWTIWAIAGGLWLVQVWRWTSRVFGHTYRVSTRRLLTVRGHIRPKRAEMKLKDIADVRIQFAWPTRWLDVGTVIVIDGAGSKMVLDGMRRPIAVADRIRNLAARARAGCVFTIAPQQSDDHLAGALARREPSGGSSA